MRLPRLLVSTPSARERQEQPLAPGHEVSHRGGSRLSGWLGLLRFVRRSLLPSECCDGKGGLDLSHARNQGGEHRDLLRSSLHGRCGLLRLIRWSCLLPEDRSWRREVANRAREGRGDHWLPVTDGRRIVLAVRRSFRDQGQDAIVALGEDAGRKGDIEK